MSAEITETDASLPIEPDFRPLDPRVVRLWRVSYLIGFGLSQIFWLSLLFLAMEGAADTVSMVLRGAILQLATPDELRGRTTAVHMTFAMGGPQLGQLRGGIIAGWIGPVAAVVSGGLAVVAVVAGMAVLVPKVRFYRL